MIDGSLISTGDCSEALAALLGPDAEGLSSSTITRLKATWWEEYEVWRKRDLKSKRYVYILHSPTARG
ncbi:Putative transposase, Mutator family protein, partial [Roseobacter sp. AzwK-3b]